jgi:hypothetical protein
MILISLLFTTTLAKIAIISSRCREMAEDAAKICENTKDLEPMIRREKKDSLFVF